MKNYIIAGTYQEAMNWQLRNDKPLDEWKYVPNPVYLKGLSEIHGVFIGTWKERPDIEEILHILATVRRPGTLQGLGVSTAILEYEIYKTEKSRV